MRRTVDEEIDAVIAAHPLRSRFVLNDTSAWVAPFERQLPFRLPPSYRSLIARYRFPSFQCSRVTMFGNLTGQERDDLVIASTRDSTLSSVIRRSGFLQVGRPETGSYDPVCFDLRNRAKSNEAELVQLDHEEILINGKISIVRRTARSFLELLAGVELPN